MAKATNRKREPKRRERSRGAFELAQTGRTQAQLAKLLGAHRTQITRWQNGDRVPNQEWRAIILRKLKIAPEKWDQSIVSPLAAAAVDGVPPEASPRARADASPPADLDIKARALEAQSQLDRLLYDVRHDTTLTTRERANTLAKAATTITQLGRLTGDAQEIGEARIVRLPAWRRIVARIIEALRPWPDAARAVADALEEWET